MDQEQINAMKIRFNFEGKSYQVGLEAYDTSIITLPDGRILVVSGWLESFPPIPMRMRPVISILATEVATQAIEIDHLP